MSFSGDRLAQAEARSDRARGNLVSTVLQLKARLSPRQLLRDTAHDLRQAGETLAENSVDAVKRRPRTTAGAVVALALMLGRHQIGKVLHRRSRTKETRKAPGRLKPLKPERKAARSRKST